MGPGPLSLSKRAPGYLGKPTDYFTLTFMELTDHLENLSQMIPKLHCGKV